MTSPEAAEADDMDVLSEMALPSDDDTTVPTEGE